MKWPRLISGKLLKRYKRFLCDIKLNNNHTITAHCPNTGTMQECYEPGCTVYLSRHTNPTRKLTYTLEMTQRGNTLVGINTQLPNHLVKEHIVAGKVPSLRGYTRILCEIPYGDNTRIDLLLHNGRKRCFIEVKNCTLVANRVAYFPDAVSRRGLKHLLALEKQVRDGDRCIMFYVIQRTDADIFKPADHIDPDYGRTLRSVLKSGVEIMAYDVKIDLKAIELNQPLPYTL